MKDVVKYKTSIVLMHDAETKASTVEALEPMIQALQGMGAEILPIDENTTVVQHIAAASVVEQQ
jgi:peptidoglycan/xylan/chitin deacetylase (PgdA/CDA1 family)